MINKLKLILFIFPTLLLYSQNISIFFLKDGSIIQGIIVNENQSRIFLKTEQGTVKIYPVDIIGREDSAKKGELSFFSERIEYLQTNDKINLELPLKFGEQISGHICQGHIDCVAKTLVIKKVDKSYLFDFEITRKERKNLIEKASICVNGEE